MVREYGLVERTCMYNKALGEPARMKMVKIIGSHDEYTLNVSAIAELLGISQPAATKHLKVMEGVGFLDRERRGASVYYSLNWDAVREYQQLMAYAFEHAGTPCPNGFDCGTCPHAATCV